MIDFTFHIIANIHRSIRNRIPKAVLLLTGSLLLLSSCAKQKVSPPPQAKKIPIVRVALDDNFYKGNLLLKTPYQLISQEATYILDESIGQLEVSYSGQELIIKNEQRWLEFRNFTRIELSPMGDGTFQWNGISYRGQLIFQRFEDALLVINILPFPEYLKGVVPYEIPSYSDEYYQAVIAQSIAARTYAYYQMTHARNPYFDLYADTRDQVYKGQKYKSPLAEKAILETMGLVLQDRQNDIKKIQYHSTCGGTINQSYLDDESIPVSSLVKDYSSEDFNCVASPYYRWVSKMTIREILQNLVRMNFIDSEHQKKWEEDGFDMNIEITSRSATGRVEEIAIQIEDTLITLKNWQIRRLFSDNEKNPLPSTLFFLKSSPSRETLFYIIGAGYGHGRGMCQWGAIGQSLSGKSYQDILLFYYPNLVLNKIY